MAVIQKEAPKQRWILNRERKIVNEFKELVREHLENEDLNHDQMAAMLGLSRTLYYEKIKGLMGVTPNEYLKNCRMKEAARLLIEDELPVWEAMLRVGFRDPKYFRDCFKKRYGKSPSDYQRFNN